MTDKYADMDPVALLEEVRKLDSRINNPITDDFIDGVRHEAAHQVERWGAPHDRGKTPLDWFWLIGFLSQKAAASAQMAMDPGIDPILDGEVEDFIHNLPNQQYLRMADPELRQLRIKLYEFLSGRQDRLLAYNLNKALHHTISTAAALLNWHAQLKGQPLDPDASMRPGIDPSTVDGRQE